MIQRTMERTVDEVSYFSLNSVPMAESHLCGSAVACEVLARRIVHLTEPEKIKNIMSNRYQHRQVDGDESEMSSALELAIDQNW